ncbi:Thioesterase [Cordyceps fumosorosea ARSEF 2679]|uniref:Thioesterase n=1 Tax=Cordyceps fumosorosea (strain ARSEF 2679) TaxID=1081104 RepID=A0A167R372_CORFA|nr:Thioesterase [Cordyceps fumosorosea ARSEF 2679]OAA58234.1 Thioesterase [Cordyceps fumosorosea ARSEF 2679]
MPGMIEENPELVQPESWARMKSWSGKTPVFLFHDGGGTTFAYHCLDPLQRFTYGVRNPHFFSGRRFEGGVPEMAAEYITRIRAAVAADSFTPKRRDNGGVGPVDILVGGWSLGGMTSLEVARQLHGDPDLRVRGILMIDSAFPALLAERRQQVISLDNEEDPEAQAREEEGKTKNQVLSMRAMREARRMIARWELPRWDWTAAIDADRGAGPRSALGWERYDERMFVDVLDVDGHHFNMFDHSRIPGITAAIAKALTRLDPRTAEEDGQSFGDSWDSAHAGF